MSRDDSYGGAPAVWTPDSRWLLVVDASVESSRSTAPATPVKLTDGDPQVAQIALRDG